MATKSKGKLKSKIPSNKFELLELPCADIKPYENNPRSHPQSQIKKLASSITTHGWIALVVVDESNTILAGHGRYLAAQYLECEKLTVIRVTGLTELLKKTYRIADNRLGLDSDWGIEQLQAEVQAIAAMDIAALEATGFTDKEINTYMNQTQELLATLDAVQSEADAEVSALEDGMTDKPHTITDTGSGVDHVAFQLSVTKANRELIMRVLKEEAASRGLRTMADALVAVLRERETGIKGGARQEPPAHTAEPDQFFSATF